MLSVVGLVPLASCSKPLPSGQVLAQIDDLDVTRRDVAVELSLGSDPTAPPSAALEQVIERKLLVRSARDSGVDRTPEFLAAVRRSRDELLSEMYVRQLARSVPRATPGEIDDYIARHSAAFANRAILSVSRVDVPATPAARTLLAGAPDAQVAVRGLKAAGLSVQLFDQTLDTATLSDTLAVALLRATSGLVIVPAASQLTAYQVKATQLAPLTGQRAQAVAARAIQLEHLTKRISDQIGDERRRANIRYQPGLGPSGT